jgi:hypothetical protein
MSTTLMPETPSAPHSPPEAIRFPAVFANLMPDEVIAGRRARALRQRVLAGLGAMLVLLVAWYGYSILQTSNAKSDLASTNRNTSKLQSQQKQFAPLLAAQQQSAAISARLTAVMSGDLQWADLVSALRKVAPSGVDVVSVNGTMTLSSSASGNGAGGGLNVLNRSGKQAVGTLMLGGKANDKDAVAAFVDALDKVHGVAAAFPASVDASAGGFTFTVNAIITTDALGGRYTPPASGGH